MAYSREVFDVIQARLYNLNQIAGSPALPHLKPSFYNKITRHSNAALLALATRKAYP